MKRHVFAPTSGSAPDASLESGTRAAACLATETLPRRSPRAPRDRLSPRRQAHSRFDSAPHTGLQSDPAAYRDLPRLR